MRVEHRIIRTLSELPDDLQHKAHERYLEQEAGMPTPWQDEYTDSLNAFCREFPIDWDSWDLSGRGIKYKLRTSAYDDAVWELTGLRLRTWILNHFDHILYKGKYYHKTTSTKPYRYNSRYGKAMIEESCCPFTGFCADEDLLAPLRAFLKAPTDHTTLENLLTDCLDSWLKALESEYEFSQSFEYFADMAEANEWEFDERGDMV